MSWKTMRRDWQTRAIEDPFETTVTGALAAGVYYSSGEVQAAELARKMATSKAQVILDYGTGMGRLGVPLSTHCKQVIGADVSPSMLRHAEAYAKKHGLEPGAFSTSQVEDGKMPGVETGSIAGIVEVMCIQHVPTKFLPGIFKEWARVLRKNGWICIKDTIEDQDLLERSLALDSENTWTSRTYTLGWYEEQLEPLGFQFVKRVHFSGRTQVVFRKKK